MKAKGIKYLVCCGLVAVAMSGCTTIVAGAAQGRAKKAVTMINESDADLLAFYSLVPFVFEGEILPRRSDVGAVWRNLSINGFSLNPTGLGSVVQVNDETFRVFADTTEMKVFFEKYIPDGTLIATIDTAGSEYSILVGKMTGGYPEILGIAGF